MTKEKDNTGALFDNDKKMSENSPDKTGSAKINGVEMWVSAWMNESKDGKPYFKLSFKKKEAKKAFKKASRPDDDIPF